MSKSSGSKGQRPSGSKSDSPLEMQRDFLDKMGAQQFQQLFEHLPGIYFFVKDRESRLICASRPILQRLGLRTEEEVIDKL